MRDVARAVVIVLALLILLAEVQRADDAQIESPTTALDNPNDF
jgi:hypothetical protein